MSLLALGVTGLIGVGMYGMANMKSKEEKNFVKIANEIRIKWLETLVLDKCTNDLGKTFDLLDIEPIQNGLKAKSLLPRGLGMDELNKRIELSEDNLNARITIDKNRYKSQIFIRIITEEPNFYFDRPTKCDDNHLWIGKTHYGKDLIIDLDDCPHYVFTGATGTGKTYMVATIVANLFWNIERMKIKNKPIVYISQIMKADWSLFAHCKPVKKVITDLEENAKLLEKLLELTDKRSKKMTERYITSIAEWNKLYGDKEYMNRIFWLGDELAFFNPVESDSKEVQSLKRRCFDALVGISRAGRSSGISILSILQRTSAKAMGGDGELRSQLGKVTLRQNSEKESTFVIDTPEAAKLEKREAIFYFGNRETFVVPTLKNKFADLKEYVPEIKTPEDFMIQNESDCEVALTSDSENIDVKNTSNLLQMNKYENHEVIRIDKVMTREEIKEYMSNLNSKIVEDTQKQSTESLLKTNLVMTKRDKEILKFVEQYGATSIKQCHKLFIKSETNCKKRLKQLEEAGKLKSYIIGGTRQKGYYMNKPRSLHDLYVLDIYIRLIELGAEILEFRQATYLNVNGKTIVPDGYVSYKLNGMKKNLYIEIDLSHFTGQSKIDLYEKLDSKFDLIIVKEGELRVKSKIINITRIDFSLAELDKVL